jgi:hypothetical protein
MEGPGLACLLQEATDPKSGSSVFHLTFYTLSCTSIEVTSGGTVLGHRIGVQHTPLATGLTKMDTCKTQRAMQVMCQHSVWDRNAMVIDYKPLDADLIIGIRSVLFVVGYVLEGRSSRAFIERI